MASAAFLFHARRSLRARDAVLLCFLLGVEAHLADHPHPTLSPSDAPVVDPALVGATADAVRKPSAVWMPAVGPRRDALDNIFWSHIPKTSTTFSRTVFSYACGETADDFFSTSTHQPPRPRMGTCTARTSVDQDALLNASASSGQGTWFHLPVPWDGERPTVRAVTLLRDPAVRMRSEFMHMTGPDGFICCGPVDRPGVVPGTSWGWSFAQRRVAVLAAQGRNVNTTAPNPREAEVDMELVNDTQARGRKYREVLSEVHSLYGCQTKMLLGIGCHEAHALTDDELARAWRYVMSPRRGLAFVGLTERYMESVCLFHATFGGTLWDFEVDREATPAFAVGGNSHDFATHSSVASNHTAEEFWGGDADADATLYALAEKRFNDAIEQRRADIDDCLEHVTTHVRRSQMSRQTR